MENKSKGYKFGIETTIVVNPNIMIAFFKSSTHTIGLGTDPFQLFGTFFNMRIKGMSGVKQYSTVLSLSRDHIQYKRGLFKKFLGYSKLYNNKTIEASTTDIVNPNTVANSLPLLIKKQGSSGFSGKV